MTSRLRRFWEKNWPEVHCALRGGLPAFLLSPGDPGLVDGIPAFCYHIPDPTSFARDLEYLAANGYNTVTADELLAHLSGQTPVPARSVVLTFDDGSVELHRVAFPLLRRFGFRAVAFVAPYFHDVAPAHIDRGRVCTWDELLEMHSSGCVDVQSHTYEHRLMRRWPEPAPICGVVNGPTIAAEAASRSLQEDLELARNRIESRLGKRVRHLCFPCYDGTSAAILAAKSVGYEGFWWGVLPGVPANRPAAHAADHIVRVSEEFLRRLPGEGRVTLASVLASRYGSSLRRFRRLGSPPLQVTDDNPHVP